SGGRFLGVTGLEMTFQWIIDHLLVLSDAPYVDASYLVNHNGDIVIQARQGAPAMAVSPMAGAAMAEETAMRAARAAEIIDLVPLPHPELREALGSGRPGQLRFVEGGRARLAVFY